MHWWGSFSLCQTGATDLLQLFLLTVVLVRCIFLVWSTSTALQSSAHLWPIVVWVRDVTLCCCSQVLAVVVLRTAFMMELRRHDIVAMLALVRSLTTIAVIICRSLDLVNPVLMEGIVTLRKSL